MIDVLHQDSADPSVLRMGEVQPLGGEAAFAAIRASIDLAMSQRVDGVVTAPINKESLQAAKIPFIGHTEMFAEYTGATEEMTMFTIVGLKIFFLTRHVSLAQACAQITVPRVAKGIDQCIKALHQLGYDAPHLAVAALNPHGGEDGMFGREEIEGIKPAIAAARAKGHRISGPVPADLVFHLARIGRYDAVLSLYHDQGHIAAKMMDFEKTVSVTLGLPVLRTSVDHGTAFDIAGTGQGERGQHDRGDPRGGGIRGARRQTGRCARWQEPRAPPSKRVAARLPRDRIARRGCSSMVERQLPKLHTRVRFPSPAPDASLFQTTSLSLLRLPYPALGSD